MLRRAFTLVEILIVVVILAILAAAVVPQFTSASDDARESTAGIVVRSMQRLISTEYAKNGSYPSSLTGTNFEGGVVPTNPYYPSNSTTFEVVSSSSAYHPTDKVTATNGSFWYNTSTGVIRARVTAGTDDAATMARYNAVNACKITALNQTT